MAGAREISDGMEPGNRAFGAASQQRVVAEGRREVPHECINSKGDGASFECNLCQELAQDPVVTICGHLFCWPCLYQWLHVHATPQECPACKASVTQGSVIPIYGRGSPAYCNARKEPFSELNVPQRPASTRPVIARPQEGPSSGRILNNVSGHSGSGATVRPHNFNLSAGFGFFQSLFGMQEVHGASDVIGYGPGYPFGWPIGWHNARLHTHPHAAHLVPDSQPETVFPQLVMVVILLVALGILIM